MYDGEVVRRKSDLYKVDYNVTASSCETADDSKFSLLVYFRELVFDAIKDLVKLGGEFEGYAPIIQGDNTGPHQDATFNNGEENFCEKEGWK